MHVCVFKLRNKAKSGHGMWSLFRILREVRELSKIKQILTCRLKAETQACLTPEPWKSNTTPYFSRSWGFSADNKIQDIGRAGRAKGERLFPESRKLLFVLHESTRTCTPGRNCHWAGLSSNATPVARRQLRSPEPKPSLLGPKLLLLSKSHQHCCFLSPL